MAKIGSLSRIVINTPCLESWASMKGDEQKRYCGQCRKHVYNLSAMSESEALALVNAPGQVCVRFCRRPDGSVMTSECGPGRRRRWRGHARLLAIIGLLLTTLGLRPAYAADNPAHEAPVPEKAGTWTPPESLGGLAQDDAYLFDRPVVVATPDGETSPTQPEFVMGEMAESNDPPPRS
jgi:hypothetical protein